MSKPIIVLGTNHRVQGLDNEGQFKRVVICLLEKHEIDVVFEEWKQPELCGTVASGLALERNLPRYNVGHLDEGEFEAYDKLREPGCPTIQMYGPIRNQINREAFFLEKIKEHMASCKAGLFICGLNHVHSMSEKLMAVGFDVKAYDWQEPIP